MAKNKKTTQKIHVKNPKPGEFYYFRFAGSIRYGELHGLNEKLSTEQEKYFKIVDERGTICPVKHHCISKNPENIKYV